MPRDPRPAETRPAADTVDVPPPESADRAPGDLTGMVVAGRYAVERLLGEGGIGRVWLARQVQLDRRVALKVLHPWLGHRKEMIQRFEREARATSRINHPGCVTVYDFGSWNDQLYIAMEFIIGESLADMLARDRRLPPEMVCDFGAQLCDVLSAAHRLDLLHRDIKPENILVTRDAEQKARIKVVDFGLAFLLGEEQSRLTREGTVAGTPAYMAPEQALNRTLDARADIYAVGCVLYELLSGIQPFSGENSFEVLQRQIYDRPEPLSRVIPEGVAPALERIVMRCLEKKRDMRPASVDEVAVALRQALTPDAPLRNNHADEAGNRASRGFPTTGSARRPEAAPPAPATRPATTARPAVAVWRSAVAGPFSDTAQAALGNDGFEPDVVDTLPPALPAVLVVDVRHDSPERARARLREALAHPSKAAIVALGPDDDFALMSEALQLGVTEFFNTAGLAKLPRAVLRAARR